MIAPTMSPDTGCPASILALSDPDGEPVICVRACRHDRW